MTDLSMLETPVPLVDLDRLERNIATMAEYASQHGLGLRPHTKTHKALTVAKAQVAHGAIGLTCATPHEAEVMAGATPDLLVAHPPVGAKADRLMQLDRAVHLMVGLDSEESLAVLAEAARRHDRPVRVLIELDLGMRRVGVTGVEEAIRLAKLVRQSAPLEYAGITFYPGHIRQQPGEERDVHLARLDAALQRALERMHQAGVAPGIVSGGSSPTAFDTHRVRGLTEFRPGTYVYHDRNQLVLGVCAQDDIAMTVLATVVSTAVPGQAVVDAGTKALGREPRDLGEDAGFGEVLGRPEVRVVRMSEEHGVLDLSQTTWRPTVGEQVRIVPNHVCIVTHLNDRVVGIRGGRVVEGYPIEARGR